MPLMPLPALSDNYIWMLTDDVGRALIVDPGQAGPVLATIGDGPPPLAVLLTHHHGDHIGGVPGLLERWPDLSVIAPDDPRIETATRRVADGDPITVANWTFDTIAVPGHTRSHVAYVCRDADGEALLFSGDTLFSLGCGRLFEGTPAQMLASLDRLAALPDDTRVCCGHEYTRSNAAFALAVEPGNDALRRRSDEVDTMRDAHRPTLPSRLADERAANPFLRIDEPAVRAAVAAHAGREPIDRADAFGLLRQWKDGFRA